MDMEEVVCHCMGVTAEDIRKAVEAGATTVEAVQQATSAGTGCGGCLDTVAELVKQFAPQ